MKQSILTVEKLRIGFKSKTGINTAVHELSFELNAGETLAIVGESGSGKSISSLALLGLLPKSATIESGSVHLHGQDILKMKESELRRIRGGKIAMIFQEPMTALTPVLSIGEQLIEGILCHQMISKQQAYKTAVEMLRVARIPEAEKRMQQFPHQLSGGMRQRVMIAMALACRPQILVADEPTTALDVTVQAQILSLMRTLQQEFGTAIILVTHDMGVVAEMADRVLVMCQGRQIEKGTVLQVLKTPQAAYTQKLLGAVPVMGNVKDSRQLISASMSARPLLEINNLSVRFDIREGLLSRVKSRVHAVEQVSFSIAKGETLALVGESGSGKSTIGRAILNLIPIETGAVRFKGRDITGWSNRLMRPLRNDMQMIFQDPMASLNPRKKVGKLVAEPMQIHTRCSKAERYQKTLKLFERVGLSEQDMQRYPHQFSGGQRQRICIARALATDPDIIVADECVSALYRCKPKLSS
jgi:peptide/nickel transport system ATP-binding protein